MSCPRCNYENRSSAQFCKKCGQPLRTSQVPAQKPSELLCSRCGTMAEPGAKFCPKCGDVLAGPTDSAALPDRSPSQPLPQPSSESQPLRPGQQPRRTPSQPLEPGHPSQRSPSQPMGSTPVQSPQRASSQPLGSATHAQSLPTQPAGASQPMSKDSAASQLEASYTQRSVAPSGPSQPGPQTQRLQNWFWILAAVMGMLIVAAILATVILF